MEPFSLRNASRQKMMLWDIKDSKAATLLPVRHFLLNWLRVRQTFKFSHTIMIMFPN